MLHSIMLLSSSFDINFTIISVTVMHVLILRNGRYKLMINKEYYDIYVREFKKNKFRKYNNMWYKKYEKITTFFKIQNLKSVDLYWVFLGITQNCALVNERPDLKNTNSIIIYFRLQSKYCQEQIEKSKAPFPNSKNSQLNDHCLNPHIAIFFATEFFKQISTSKQLIHFINTTDLISEEQREIALCKIPNDK